MLSDVIGDPLQPKGAAALANAGENFIPVPRTHSAISFVDFPDLTI
jgi:hypothetical protein